MFGKHKKDICYVCHKEIFIRQPLIIYKKCLHFEHLCCYIRLNSDLCTYCYNKENQIIKRKKIKRYFRCCSSDQYITL